MLLREAWLGKLDTLLPGPTICLFRCLSSPLLPPPLQQPDVSEHFPPRLRLVKVSTLSTKLKNPPLQVQQYPFLFPLTEAGGGGGVKGATHPGGAGRGGGGATHPSSRPNYYRLCGNRQMTSGVVERCCVPAQHFPSLVPKTIQPLTLSKGPGLDSPLWQRQQQN